MHRPVRGTVDLFGAQMAKRSAVEMRLCNAAELCGFSRVETPVVEHFALFHRTLGQSSEVVSKEMFRLQSAHEGSGGGDDALVLRPESTASVVRAVLNANLQHHLPLNFYYFGAQFRYERPQRGRQRQFTQFGVESFGKNTLEADLESISSANFALKQVLGNEARLKLKINTLGTCEADRGKFTDALLEHLLQHKSQLSQDTLKRIEEHRILRVLDSKDRGDIQVLETAPHLIDFLPEAEVSRINDTCTLLKEVHGLKNVELDPKLVRGLDYYSQVCFEFVSEELGLTVCAGGRYDGLAKSMGHVSTLPAIGWACGVERIELLMEEVSPPKLGVLVVPLFTGNSDLDSKIQFQCSVLCSKARLAGVSARAHCGGRTEKNALKKALKEAESARYACFVGEQEIHDGVVTVRHVSTGAVEKKQYVLAQDWISSLNAS